MKLKKRAVAALNRALAGAGLRLVRWGRDDAFLEGGLRRILSVLEVDGVLDVGANAGQYGALLRSLGFKGAILSFEPVQASFEDLTRASADDPGWQAFAVALGSTDEERTIATTRFSLLSSFLEPSEFSGEVFGAESEVVCREAVPVRRLDRLLPELWPEPAPRRIFLKTDTQGFDLEVIEGAGDVLRKVVGLQVELSAIPLYEGMPDYLETLAKLRGLGFEVAGLHPIFRKPGSLAIAEFDCLLVRSALEATSPGAEDLGPPATV
jgi:FkbM family methyltransferase